MPTCCLLLVGLLFAQNNRNNPGFFFRKQKYRKMKKSILSANTLSTTVQYQLLRTASTMQQLNEKITLAACLPYKAEMYQWEEWHRLELQSRTSELLVKCYNKLSRALNIGQKHRRAWVFFVWWSHEHIYIANTTHGKYLRDSRLTITAGKGGVRGRLLRV